MPQEEFNYTHLFWALNRVIQDCTEFNASCKCKDCDFVKRVRVYFNLLKSHSVNPKSYSDFCYMMLDREEGWVVNTFLYSFLQRVDEDAMMDKLFDNKEDMTTDEYLSRCDMLMSIKNFKNMMVKSN
jgi:hypothetical protein